MLLLFSTSHTGQLSHFFSALQHWHLQTGVFLGNNNWHESWFNDCCRVLFQTTVFKTNTPDLYQELKEQVHLAKVQVQAHVLSATSLIIYVVRIKLDHNQNA